MDLQQRPEIAYLCDGKIERCQEIGCGVTQSGNFRECYHTSDINHAKNFRKLDDSHYVEIKADEFTNGRPHGEWIDVRFDEVYGQIRKCSECGAEILPPHMSYCPNCSSYNGGIEE